MCCGDREREREDTERKAPFIAGGQSQPGHSQPASDGWSLSFPLCVCVELNLGLKKLVEVGQ